MDTRIAKLFVLTLTLTTLAACGITTSAPTPTPTLPPPAVVVAEPTVAPTSAPAPTVAAAPGYITGRTHLVVLSTPAMVVYALDPATGQWAFTKAQASEVEGTYTLTVPAGTYQVFAAIEAGAAVGLGYWKEADASTLATVSVAAGQTISDINIRPPSQSECGSMLSLPASPDGRFAATVAATKECLDSAAKATPLAQTPPMRIQFAAGGTSAKITGGFGVSAGADLPDTYVLGAAAGQAMTVNLTATAGGQPVTGGAYLHVWGADGAELASVEPQVATWQGALPSTQDYYIGVIFAAKTPIEYTLDVTILPAGQATGPVLPKVVPAEFNLFLQTLTDTDVPLILPPSFPVEAGQPAIYPAVITSDTGEYELSLDYGPNCHGAGACHYGSLSGKKVSGSEPVGTTNNPYEASQAQKVALTQGIQGYLIPFTCGASCGDTQVYWIVNGYQYMLGLKGGSKTAVINLANAAIQNSSSTAP